MRKIVIVGAGAMGCLFAARLIEGGASVTLVDVDAARLAVLDRAGIAISDDRGERVIPVRASVADAVNAPVDLVLLFTKGMHSRDAIRSVAHLVTPEVVALTLQNGLGNAEAVAEVFPPDRVVMGVTDLPADLDGPNRVSSHGPGTINLGGFVPAAQPRAEAVAALFTSSGLSAHADPEVRVAVWEKVAFNAALNPIAAVTGLTADGMNRPAGLRIASAIVTEVVATAAALGITLDRARIDAKIDFALSHHHGHKTSMLQDRIAGRITEIESINGAVARAAEAAGVPTPVTSTMANLMRLLEPRADPAAAA